MKNLQFEFNHVRTSKPAKIIFKKVDIIQQRIDS